MKLHRTLTLSIIIIFSWIISTQSNAQTTILTNCNVMDCKEATLQNNIKVNE